MTKPAPDAPSPDDANVYAPPVSPPPKQPAAEQKAAQATPGQRLAGALLIVSAVLWLVESLLGGRGLFEGPFTTPLMRALPAALDVVLGGALVLGLRRVAWLAGARVVLVLAAWTFLLVARDRITAAPAIVLGMAYLLLLVRDAGKPRMVVGGVLWGLCLLLDVVGLRAAVTGRNPIAVFVQIREGEIEPAPVTVVTGEQSHYRLRLPSGEWYLHTRASTQREGPLADRFLSRPDVDAHLLVLVQKFPGKLPTTNGLVQEVGRMARRDAETSELVRLRAMRAHREEGRLLWIRTTKAGVETGRLVAVVATYEWSFMLIATAPSRIFPEIEAELEGILESFELPTDEKHGLPPDVEPHPVDVVEGVAAKYRLKAPGARWFLRKDEAVKKDNSLADRWIMRPDKDAHVIVIIEDLQGKDVGVDAFADAAVELIEKELKGTVESRLPVLTHPTNGRLLRANRMGGEHEIVSYYGLFTQAGRAFTVIASATSERFPSAGPDLVQVIESFELPPEGAAETR
ncbi:hypothetical protein [Polyangium fumosum]|uniref:Uncharacterized protein n=1 Tax=Polyangium fumosum TaxID=889272 RepID=A0A4U1JD72_9BACT|nr:hypothetical protein [Polyangium fumosum]TKD08644.1 hypothetical protein E8A74_15290 [Polyangium fumosum]